MENEGRELSDEMKRKLAPMFKAYGTIGNKPVLPIIDLQKTRDDLLKKNIKQLKKQNKLKKKDNYLR